MKSKQLIKTLAFLGLIIIFSFYYNAKELKKAIKTFQKSKGINEITVYEKRFAMLMELLPKQGVVGYISNKFDDPAEDAKAFQLTQYAMTPIIVVRGKNRPLIVGNFNNTDIEIEIYEKDGLILAEDFGNGVLLFERKDN
jgi:hypothetical protein